MLGTRDYRLNWHHRQRVNKSFAFSSSLTWLITAKVMYIERRVSSHAHDVIEYPAYSKIAVFLNFFKSKNNNFLTVTPAFSPLEIENKIPSRKNSPSPGILKTPTDDRSRKRSMTFTENDDESRVNREDANGLSEIESSSNDTESKESRSGSTDSK